MRERRRDGAELHFNATFEQIERRLGGAAIRRLCALELRAKPTLYQ
jgi:hypothetical protein